MQVQVYHVSYQIRAQCDQLPNVTATSPAQSTFTFTSAGEFAQVMKNVGDEIESVKQKIISQFSKLAKIGIEKDDVKYTFDYFTPIVFTTLR